MSAAAFSFLHIASKLTEGLGAKSRWVQAAASLRELRKALAAVSHKATVRISRATLRMEIGLLRLLMVFPLWPLNRVFFEAHVAWVYQTHRR